MAVSQYPGGGYHEDMLQTSWVVACGQQDAPSRLHLSNDMTSSWCTEDAILPDDEFSHTISSSNLCD